MFAPLRNVAPLVEKMAQQLFFIGRNAYIRSKFTIMAQGNNIIKTIRAEAKREAEKDFAADWGLFWKVAGSWIGQYLMAFVGFFADFAVAFSMLYGATKHGFASFLGAAAVCVVIQYGYGGATFRITKAFKNGKIAEGRYARSAIIGGAFGLATLGASLYLSFNFDAVFRTASEPVAARELKDEGAVNAYYDEKIATIRNDYNAQYETLQEQRKQLSAQRTDDGQIVWLSRKSIAKMDDKTIPALRSGYEKSVAALETERAQRLQQTLTQNETTAAKWDAKITEGAMFTRWFNIAVNLLRVLLIIGYAIFLLDVYQDEEETMGKTQSRARVSVPNAPPSLVPRPVSFTQRDIEAMLSGETTPPPPAKSVSNKVAERNAQRKEVAKELEKARANVRSYQSRIGEIKTALRNTNDAKKEADLNARLATATAGLDKYLNKVAEIEEILETMK